MNRAGYTLVALACVIFGAANLGKATYIHLKALLAQRLMVSAWERAQHGADRPRPWPWADTSPIARLYAPDYGVALFVLSGDSGRTLAFGPGHQSESALPGEPGTCLINGHRDTHFHFLKRLHVGDWLCVETPDGESIAYTVVKTEVMDSRSSVIRDAPDIEALVLVTCYPFDALRPGGPLRYVVTALRSGRPRAEHTHEREGSSVLRAIERSKSTI